MNTGLPSAKQQDQNFYNGQLLLQNAILGQDDNNDYYNPNNMMDDGTFTTIREKHEMFDFDSSKPHD